MARKIIITVPPVIDSEKWSVRGVYWLDAPANNPLPLPTFASVVPPVASAPNWGITAVELAALQAGTSIEVSFGPLVIAVVGLAAGPAQTKVAAAVLADYQAAQNTLTATTPAAKFIGSSYNVPGGWVVGP